MTQVLKNIVATPAVEANEPERYEEVLVGSFCAIGRQFGPVVTITLANRIASAIEADEIDELSGFDLFISRLQGFHSEYFVFDISKVTQIDHAALRHFLGAKSILENGGGRVVLTGTPSSDDRLLSHLLTLLPHFSSSEEALRYVQSDEFLSTHPDKGRITPEGRMPAQLLKAGDGTGIGADGKPIGLVNNPGACTPRSDNAVEDDTNSWGSDGDEILGDRIFEYYPLAGC